MPVKNIKLEVTFIEYDSSDDLSVNDRELLEHANNAINSAYAPYSGYQVGAAVELENGEIVIGSNQENVAFPSGLCAERVAIFAAASQYPDITLKTVAITSKARDFHVDTPVTPCGACRQVIAEYERNQGKKIRLILAGETGKVYLIEGMENLLPLMFKVDQLKL